MPLSRGPEGEPGAECFLHILLSSRVRLVVSAGRPGGWNHRPRCHEQPGGLCWQPGPRNERGSQRGLETGRVLLAPEPHEEVTGPGVDLGPVEPRLCSPDPGALTRQPPRWLTNAHSPRLDPDDVLLITSIPKVPPFPVKIKMTRDEAWLRVCGGGSELRAGARLLPGLLAVTPQWLAWVPLPASTHSPCRPRPPQRVGPRVPPAGDGRAPPSGGRDAALLALDLEELGHAGEVLLAGLRHLLLRCLWVHNLQALGRGGTWGGVGRRPGL